MNVLKVGPPFLSLDTVMGSREVKEGSKKLLLVELCYFEDMS